MFTGNNLLKKVSPLIMPRTNRLVLLLILILMPCVITELVSAKLTTKPSPPEFMILWRKSRFIFLKKSIRVYLKASTVLSLDIRFAG